LPKILDGHIYFIRPICGEILNNNRIDVNVCPQLSSGMPSSIFDSKPAHQSGDASKDGGKRTGNGSASVYPNLKDTSFVLEPSGSGLILSGGSHPPLLEQIGFRAGVFGFSGQLLLFIGICVAYGSLFVRSWRLGLLGLGIVGAGAASHAWGYWLLVSAGRSI